MGKRYLIDTNVITKYFEETLSEQGLSLIDNILEASECHISIITRIELLSFSPKNENLLGSIYTFLNASEEYSLSELIVQKTIELRKTHKIKLPDAIIAATSLCYDLILLSDNDSDFGKIPYLRYINPRKYKG